MGTNRVRSVLALALVVLVTVGVLSIGVGVAGAQRTRSGTYPTVPTKPPPNPCAHDGSLCGTLVVGGRSSTSSLPFTGGDVALLTVLGLGAIGAGAAILVLSRRRSTTVGS